MVQIGVVSVSSLAASSVCVELGPNLARLSVVAQWGIGCADENFPGVYARVSRAYDWIEEEVCASSQYAVDAGFYCPNAVPCATFRNRRHCEERPDCYWAGVVCVRNPDVKLTPRPTRRPVSFDDDGYDDDDDDLATTCDRVENRGECKDRPDCDWSGVACYRHSDLACDNVERSSECQARPECYWDGLFCRGDSARSTRQPASPSPTRPLPSPTHQVTPQNPAPCHVITNKHVCKIQAGCRWWHNVCFSEVTVNPPVLQNVQSTN